ncbi:MAG: peptidylprolyl isomerase [Candidatus Hydrothermales bacterium]
MKILFSLIIFTSENLLYRDRIVAVVDKKPILESEVKEALKFFKLLKPELKEEEEKDLRKKILESLIENELILIEAKKDTTIKVEHEEINSYLEDEISRLKKEMGDSVFADELRKENLNEETLKEKYYEQVERNLYIQKYIAKYITPKIEITPSEIEKFYNDYIDSIPELPEGFEISHIFIPVKPSKEIVETARKKAESVYKELKEGADFGYLALKYSDDKFSAIKGGDIGYIERGTFPQEVEEKLYKSKKGEILQPIQGDLGFFIFQIVDKKENKIHLRQIVIATLPTKEDTIRTLNKAKEAIKFAEEKGFEEAVRKYSEDPLTKDKKGYLGFVPSENLKEDVKTKLLNSKDGDIVGPFYLDYGYHIFKRIYYSRGGKPSFEEIKFQIQNLLFQRKVQQLLKKKASELKDKVYFEIFDQ